MVGSSKRGCSSTANTGKPAAAGDEKKRRKKLQNRLNQRAYRSRNQENGNTKTNTKIRRYQVDRWKLDEYQALHSGQPPPAQDSPTRASQALAKNLDSIQQPINETTWFPLPADHLLHLIKYNVFRGLWQNKMTLENLAVQYHAANHSNGPFSDNKTFPRFSVIVPTASLCAGCLTPTPLQTTVVHSTWINFIPFSMIRENLIKWEFAFDHADLVRDLVGDLIDLKIFLSTSTFTRPSAHRDLTVRGGNNDEVAVKETGLILWGEPHIAESWEATPGFLRKWAWAVAGCQELINSSNYWRGVRGERPLRLFVEN